MKKEVYAKALRELVTADGEITPDAVVTAASDPENDLHSYFDWDDSSAATKYRIDQARKLICSVTVVIETTDKIIKIPEYIRDPNKTGSEQGYLLTAKVKTDEDLRQEAIASEFGRASSALRRAREIAVYFDIEKAVDDVIVSVDNLHEQVSAPQ